jgi:energy-coupling factor transport system permease protein
LRLTFPFHETWLHRVNPSIKLLLLICLFIIVIMIHNLDMMINFTILALVLLVFFTGHPWKRLLLYSSPFVLIFIGSAASMIFFGKGDITWVKWGLLHITEESFYRGVHLGFRSLNFAILGLLFALTTRPVNLFYSLMQQCNVSPKYAYSFMAGLRLLPILFDEFQTLRYAIKVRGGFTRKGIRGFYQKLHFYSIPLLAQSIRRAQRIAVAMEAKRFSQTETRPRTYYYKISVSGYDGIFIFYFIVALGAAYLVAQQYPYFGIADVRYYG